MVSGKRRLFATHRSQKGLFPERDALKSVWIRSLAVFRYFGDFLGWLYLQSFQSGELPSFSPAPWGMATLRLFARAGIYKHARQLLYKNT